LLLRTPRRFLAAGVVCNHKLTRMILEISFETSLFYGFTIIPIVTAILIATYSAFLLTKLQLIKTSIIGFGKHLLKVLDEIRSISDMKIDTQINSQREFLIEDISREDIEAINIRISTINEALKNISNTSQELAYYENRGMIKVIGSIQKKCHVLKSDLYRKSKQLYITSGILIVLSISCLPLIPLLNLNNLIFAFLVFSLQVAGLIFCIYRTLYMIFIFFKKDY